MKHFEKLMEYWADNLLPPGTDPDSQDVWDKEKHIDDEYINDETGKKLARMNEE